MVPVALAIGLVAACAPPGSSGGGAGGASGPSVEAGSDASAYAEALKDEKPIQLDFGGHVTGPGAPGVDAFVEWTDKVTEMSGGKITFKHDFAGAKVSIDKMADALKQGRMDMGLYAPTYAPEAFPVTDLFAGMSTSERQDPVAGRMTTFAARAEFAKSFEPLVEETEDAGVLPLYPLYGTSGAVKLHCKDKQSPTSLADLKGHRVRISNPLHKGMAEAIGMTPVSLTATELFSGLQRGVVDCSVTGISQVTDAGLDEVTNSWSFGDGAGHDWIESPISWGFSQKTWDSLPLAAQQLLWDMQDELLKGQITVGMKGFQTTMAKTKKGGFDFGTYDSDVTAKMEAYHKKTRDTTAKSLEEKGYADDGQAVVKQYADLNDKWWKVITEELGYPADATWQDLPTDYDAKMSSIDLDPFLDKFVDEVLAEGRPGSGS